MSTFIFVVMLMQRQPCSITCVMTQHGLSGGIQDSAVNNAEQYLYKELGLVELRNNISQINVTASITSNIII